MHEQPPDPGISHSTLTLPHCTTPSRPWHLSFCLHTSTSLHEPPPDPTHLSICISLQPLHPSLSLELSPLIPSVKPVCLLAEFEAWGTIKESNTEWSEKAASALLQHCRKLADWNISKTSSCSLNMEYHSRHQCNWEIHWWLCSDKDN